LFADHDGHLMPGGMALAWINSHLAPLDVRLPLLEIALLQLLAGAALARLLWVLLRGRPVLLAPLLLASVVPLGLPAATWWAAAVNALPLSAAMAWAAASTVRLAETGRRRHAVGAGAATVGGLVFAEESVLVPVGAAGGRWGRWWSAPGDEDEARSGDRARAGLRGEIGTRPRRRGGRSVGVVVDRPGRRRRGPHRRPGAPPAPARVVAADPVDVGGAVGGARRVGGGLRGVRGPDRLRRGHPGRRRHRGSDRPRA